MQKHRRTHALRASARIVALLCALAPGLKCLAQDTAAEGWSGRLRGVLASSARAECPGIPGLRTAGVDNVLSTLYARNGFAPLWIDAARLAALQRELRLLDGDGLAESDFGAALAAGMPRELCDELALSGAYLRALEQLSRGRVDLARSEPRWEAAAPRLPALAELALRGMEDMAAAFAAARPTAPLYRDLRAAYVRMRDAVQPWPSLPAGPTLGPGSRGPRVAQLARRLHADGYLAVEQADTYDAALQRAVRAFQADHALIIDGLVGRRTRAELNVPYEQRLRQLRVNLERFRWLAAHDADALLLVNVAGGDIRLYDGGRVVWRARVLTGRPERRTPLLVSRIERLTLNPSWIVPPTILEEDQLPQIRADLGFLENNRLEVVDSAGVKLDPAQVDWTNPVGIFLRQPPGPANPLGALAFRLQSPYFISLHDTPGRELFDRAARNVSSGCIRVEDAAGLAERLLMDRSPDERTAIAQLGADGGTHEVALPEGPRIIVAYWTAEGTAAGMVKYFADPYGLDAPLGEALGEAGDAVAVQAADGLSTGCAG